MRRAFAHRCRSLIKHPVYAKFFCPDCHKPDLDQFQRSVNYFLLYLLPQSFTVDNTLLVHRYREYQRLLHPDILQARGLDCQDYSKCISLAYTTLQLDVTRAQYLVRTMQLQLHGRALTPESTFQDAQFMEEMFDLRCELQAAREDCEALARVVRTSQREKAAYVQAVGRAFEEKDWKTAEELTVRLQFLQKLCEDAKEMGREAN